MKPKKSLKSRYSTNIPKGNYGTVSISNDDIIVGHKSNSVLEQGYIFMPYIMSETTGEIIFQDKILMDNLKEKIQRLKRNIKINDLLDDREEV